MTHTPTHARTTPHTFWVVTVDSIGYHNILIVLLNFWFPALAAPHEYAFCLGLLWSAVKSENEAWLFSV